MPYKNQRQYNMTHDLFSTVYDKGGKLMETKDAKNGGYLVGRSHKEGGIKGVNVDTGDPIEVEGGEVVITKPAVDSNKYYTLNGKKMKPKDILSKLNSDHGGVAFAEGGKVGSRKYLLGGMTNDEKKDFVEARYAGKSIIIATNDDLNNFVNVLNGWDEMSGGIIDIKVKTPNNTIDDVAMIDAITIGDYLYLKGLNKVANEGNHLIDNPSVDFFVTHIPFIITELVKDTDGTKYDVVVMERTYLTNNGYERKEIMRWKRDAGWYNDRSVCMPKIENTDLSNPINSSDWLNGKIVLAAQGNQFDDMFCASVFGYGEFTVDYGITANCSYRQWDTGADYNAKRINPARANNFAFDNGNVYLHAVGDIVDIEYRNNYAYYDVMNVDNSQSTELFIHEGVYFLQGYDNNTPLFYSGQSGGEIFFTETVWTLNTNNTDELVKTKVKILNIVLYRDISDRNYQLIGLCVESIDTGQVFFIKLWTPLSRNEFRITPVEPATEGSVGMSTTLSDEEKEIRRKRKKDERNSDLYNILIDGLNEEEAKLIVMKSLVNPNDTVKNLNIDRRLNEIVTLRDEYKLDAQTALNLIDQFETVFYVEKSTRENLFMANSINGQPTQLTETQYKRVYSPEFIQWFGDWMTAYELGDYTGVSKVVNPVTAEPMVLFHGTDADFTAWKFNNFPVAYFGDNKTYSEWFANIKSTGGEGHMYECFINIKNPIDMRQYGLDSQRMGDILTYLQQTYGLNPTDIIPELKRVTPEQYETVMNVTLKAWQFVRRGIPFLNFVKENTFYDGILMFEDNPQDIVNGEPNTTGSYVVFREGQIKWAGASFFNSIISDNRFAKGGKVKSLSAKYNEMDFVF
jgi:hypothetical protein